jgi:hypothetical protein
MIFFNKADLFKEKLKKFPLKDFFPDFEGTILLLPVSLPVTEQIS